LPSTTTRVTRVTADPRRARLFGLDPLEKRQLLSLVIDLRVAGGGKTAQSDNGSFTLSGLDAGTVNITFTQSQHQTLTRTVRIGEG